MTARSYSRSLGSVGRNEVENLVSLFLEVHMLTRRSILAAGVLAPFTAKAQTWPSGIIKIVTPFAAGGPSDGIARIIQPGLQQRLGVTVIIENKPGASATLGKPRRSPNHRPTATRGCSRRTHLWSARCS